MLRRINIVFPPESLTDLMSLKAARKFRRDRGSVMTSIHVITSAMVTSLLECARLCSVQCQAFSLDEDMLCVTGFSHEDEDVILPNKVQLYIERR